MIQLCINFLSPLSHTIIGSIIVCIANSIGCYRLHFEHGTMLEVLTQNNYMTNFIIQIFFGSIAIIFLQHLLVFGQKEILNAWQKTEKIQKEVINILDNFEEAIISQNTKGFGYCNKSGHNLLY